jgi:hypothetical protein
MTNINELWYSSDPQAWNKALARYWDYVKKENEALERELEVLDLESIKRLDALGWYDFLLNKYFKWKYTAPNRYATTTKYVRQYIYEGRLSELLKIKNDLLMLENLADVESGLSVAKKIKGLGTAGASGLLSLMYPHTFATVDQFVVKALRDVRDLPETSALGKMNENALTIKNGVLLIDIMRRKALGNNRSFSTADWTPRKIDKILWTFGR